MVIENMMPMSDPAPAGLTPSPASGTPPTEPLTAPPGEVVGGWEPDPVPAVVRMVAALGLDYVRGRAVEMIVGGDTEGAVRLLEGSR